ncbi:hypothetical protein [uncultured Roseovarius sp.]|uniref:hypothetical protein n=1 Tax=uncultured Roseovarius sp. TaxID=293344 RepID=UPI0026375273|nr:hypothetical protein [uncultured Roseovarius sp.]
MNRASPSGAPTGKVVNPTRRLSAQIFLLLMLVANTALLINAMAFKQRLEAIHSASGDNSGWVVSQLDVDHQGLLRVLDGAALFLRPDVTRPVDLATFHQIKQEFDILYSRLDILPPRSVACQFRNRHRPRACCLPLRPTRCGRRCTA